MTLSLDPAAAWDPLPAENWDAGAARHLLRRAGWSAQPDDLDRATAEGLTATLERLFPARPAFLPKPRLIARFEETAAPRQQEIQRMSGEDKLRAQRELQERGRAAIQELTIRWLSFAAAPETAALAKWNLFLSDVYVVSAEKVRNAAQLYGHFATLAQHGFGPAPALTKAVSRSPAMVLYLDLQQSQRKAPNENFARELFELFVLGEGHYTEADIKEAARAFTGYRALPPLGEFRFVAQQHDAAPKTVFGETGNFSGDEIIDLAYRQEAAARYLPSELAKFYLTHDGLAPDYLATLGAAWRQSGFDLRALALKFFGSRVFFAPEFRGNFIKSPVQFFLGLLHDLRLDVAPIQRLTVVPLRQMGQALFFPPNVRGWVGGRSWINSSTLGARRLLVELLLSPLDEKNLNADEQLELAAARSNGAADFVATEETFSFLSDQPPVETARRLTTAFLPSPASSPTIERLEKFLAAGISREPQRLRQAAAIVLQLPEYHLC